MRDDNKKSTSPSDDELQREIRAGRKFTLTEAIGRMAGLGAMKGVSPISLKKQAENLASTAQNAIQNPMQSIES